MENRFEDFITWIRKMQVAGQWTSPLKWDVNGRAYVSVSTPIERRDWHVPVKISRNEAEYIADELDIEVEELR